MRAISWGVSAGSVCSWRGNAATEEVASVVPVVVLPAPIPVPHYPKETTSAAVPKHVPAPPRAVKDSFAGDRWKLLAPLLSALVMWRDVIAIGRCAGGIASPP